MQNLDDFCLKGGGLGFLLPGWGTRKVSNDGVASDRGEIIE